MKSNHPFMLRTFEPPRGIFVSRDSLLVLEFPGSKGVVWVQGFASR